MTRNKRQRERVLRETNPRKARDPIMLPWDELSLVVACHSGASLEHTEVFLYVQRRRATLSAAPPPLAASKGALTVSFNGICQWCYIIPKHFCAVSIICRPIMTGTSFPQSSRMLVPKHLAKVFASCNEMNTRAVLKAVSPPHSTSARETDHFPSIQFSHMLGRDKCCSGIFSSMPRLCAVPNTEEAALVLFALNRVMPDGTMHRQLPLCIAINETHATSAWIPLLLY